MPCAQNAFSGLTQKCTVVRILATESEYTHFAKKFVAYNPTMYDSFYAFVPLHTHMIPISYSIHCKK